MFARNLMPITRFKASAYHVLIALIVCTYLLGCVEIEETYTLRLDGSGTLKLTVSLDEKLAEYKLKGNLSPIDRMRRLLDEKSEELKAYPTINRVERIPEKQLEGKIVFGLIIDSSDMTKLEQVLKALDSGNRKSKPTSILNITQNDNQIQFKRQLFPREQTDADISMRPGVRQALERRLTGQHHTIKVYVPTTQLHLKQGLQLEEDVFGPYVIWRHEMTKLINLEKPIDMQLQVLKPVKTNQNIIVILILVISGAGLISILVLIKRKKQETPQEEQVEEVLLPESVSTPQVTDNQISSSQNQLQSPMASDTPSNQGRSEWQNIEL